MDDTTAHLHEVFETYLTAAHEHEREAEALHTTAQAELREAARIADWLDAVWGEDER